MARPSMSPHKRALYERFRFDIGLSKIESAKRAGVSRTWAHEYENALDKAGDLRTKQLRREQEGGGPKPPDHLTDVARDSLDDFAAFRKRYLGRVASPWQAEAAHRALALLESPYKEYVVVNCPPGSGKSTLFAHDIPAWLTCRNRGIRGLIGSRTGRQATQYTRRLRRTFERETPVEAKEHEKAKGRAFDAEASLVVDFGPFRPLNSDLWTAEQFVVEQLGYTPSDEKEATWSSFGMDSGSLGWRVDFIAWDDLVDKTTIRNVEQIERQRQWWEDEAETRLEPDGLLILQGQRLSSEDLYRYCLDMAGGDPDEWEDPEDIAAAPPKYQHIVFKAHYEEHCRGNHKPSTALPYPGHDAPAYEKEGRCLLDPVRIPWRELRTIKANRGSKFEVLYQQQDVDPETVLVPALWVSGGRDPKTGDEYPGCWDKDRGLCELPRGLSGDLLSVATADPSPTEFWAIEWWVYHPDSEQRFLMDLVRQRMTAAEFLDWNYNGNVFTGVMEEWQERSFDIGAPISTWVVEANAAQRFMLQYEHVRRWMALRSVNIISHQTHRNKSDEDYGVQMLAPHWQYGRVRLPGKQGLDEGRHRALKLVDEVTRWPAGRYDDCVMAQWFFEHNLEALRPMHPDKMPRLTRPSWFGYGASGKDAFERAVGF